MIEKLVRGTPCFVSTRGHNNFWYPIFDETGLTKIVEDVEDHKIKTWICGNNDLMAVEVSVGSVKDLYGDPNGRTIVWVDKKFLNKKTNNLGTKLLTGRNE